MALMNVVYKINDVDFETKECYVSQSHGLTDIPERKPVLSYEWPDEDGTQYDLGVAPKFKERKIWLDVFFTGSNWTTLKANFNDIMAEFKKQGLQTLKVKPWSMAEMSFDVFLAEPVILEKIFRNERMFGVCTIVMIEPEPTL